VRRAGVVVVWLVACAASAREVPTANRVPEHDVAELVRRAEQALADDRRLDYARPFADKPHEPVAARFLDACRAGDRRSCWIAAQLDGGDVAKSAGELVHANCRAGDAMSCRADLTSEGRSDACADSLESCDAAKLRAECENRLAVSCERLLHVRPVIADWEAIKVRTAQLARDGCAAGILAECVAWSASDDGDHDLAAEQRCTLAYDCMLLGNAQLARKHGDAARDAFELECQRGRRPAPACEVLGAHYIAGTLREPTPGRGKALVEWACAHDDALRRIAKSCRMSGR